MYVSSPADQTGQHEEKYAHIEGCACCVSAHMHVYLTHADFCFVLAMCPSLREEWVPA